MEKTEASKKPQSKLTDFETFWKIILLVCVSIIAEALIIWAATSDMAVEWTYSNVFKRKVNIEEVSAADINLSEDANLTDTNKETADLEANVDTQ